VTTSIDVESVEVDVARPRGVVATTCVAPGVVPPRIFTFTSGL
jgi:hypothetical protein